MALDYDQINAVTRSVLAPALIDNLFQSGINLRLSVQMKPGRGWREMFEEIDKMDEEKEVA